jgi:D-amino peptidase
MTRLLIVLDMEGISGIERYEQCVRGHPEYDEGVRLLCSEVNVIAETALTSGARSVSVIDWHGGGGNLDPKQLDERVEIIPEDLSQGFDVAFLIGFHPMAGDNTGFISHTMRQGLAVEVHGQQIGELSLLAWWLGEHDIPVGLISGDRSATSEADRLFPDTPLHTVKRAESWDRAACIPLEQSFEALRRRVARVLEQQGRWEVYRPSLPLQFRLKLQRSNPLPGLLPWLDEQPDGWLAGKVDHTRDLIDLIDVLSGIINLQTRNDYVKVLARDPGVRKRMNQIQRERITEQVEHGYWNP